MDRSNKRLQELEEKRSKARVAKTKELIRLHIALLFLGISVFQTAFALSVIWFSNGDIPFNGFIFFIVIYTPPIPLAIADSIWSLGERKPAEEFSKGYLWLLIWGPIGGLVSLFWMFVSYPFSLKAIHDRYPELKEAEMKSVIEKEKSEIIAMISQATR